jgi:Flp pilus assembly protein TadB
MKFIGNYFRIFKSALFLGGVKENAKSLKKLSKDFRGLDDPSDIECNSFDDLFKLGMTEEKLQKARKVCYKMSLFALFIACCLVGYLAFSIIKNYYTSSIVTFLLALVLFGLSFRYHFWYMQVTKRRLGCTFGDWLSFVFSKDKH